MDASRDFQRLCFPVYFSSRGSRALFPAGGEALACLYSGGGVADFLRHFRHPARLDLMRRCPVGLLSCYPARIPREPGDAGGGSGSTGPCPRLLQIPWLFAGGDNVGRNFLVYAISDGKVAAWNIHKDI